MAKGQKIEKKQTGKKQKCKHNMIITQCAVCQKDIETAIRYMLGSLYNKRPTLKELYSVVEQVATKNPMLFGQNKDASGNVKHVS